jgi:hypothetical protein
MPGTGRTSAGHAQGDLASARRRLDQGLARLHEAGAEVGGEIGNHSPLTAVTDCLAHRRFDEIILSTLPSGVSRWLHQDLPKRIRRKFDLPVTHIVTNIPEMPRFFRPANPVKSSPQEEEIPAENAGETHRGVPGTG